MAHRLFLREMRDYRACALPAAALAGHAVPSLRLLGESWRELAGRAVERGVQALACWYDPRPLFGVLDRLRPDTSGDASPALEHLARILPRRVFRTVSRVLEQEDSVLPDETGERDRLHGWIRAAWENDDAWLRAVAVRAARDIPGLDGRLFDDDGGDPMVRDEIAALRAPRAPRRGGGAMRTAAGPC
jgi:hypothetical protein